MYTNTLQITGKMVEREGGGGEEQGGGGEEATALSTLPCSGIFSN